MCSLHLESQEADYRLVYFFFSFNLLEVAPCSFAEGAQVFAGSVVDHTS